MGCCKDKHDNTLGKMRRECLGLLVLLIVASLLTGCKSEGKKLSNLQKGAEALKTLDYASAKEFYSAALNAGEDAERAYRGAGMACLGLSMYDEAIECFEKALSECNGFISDIELDISYYLAVAEVKKGDYEAAYNTYSALIAYDKDNALARYLRGRVSLDMGNLDKAMEDYDRAIVVNPTDYDIYINAFKDLDAKGYDAEAKSYIARALDNTGKKEDYTLGLLYYYMGKYEDARNCLERARGKKDSEEMVMTLGKTYEALGDVNYALSLYSEYLTANPGCAIIYNRVGMMKLNMGDYQGALTAFDSGIATGDTDYLQNMKFNEIVCYEYLGDFNKALVTMEEYLSLYPSDEQALREYEFLKTR